MRLYQRAALHLLVLASTASPCTARADTNVTFGDCSPIINIQSITNETLQRSIKEKYPDIDFDSIEVVVKIVNCGQEIQDPTKRRQILFFALDKMLKIKRTQYIPALDGYLTDPSAENFELMARTGKRNVRQIEDAIDKLVDYQVTIEGSNDPSLPLKKLGGSADARLRGMERELMNRLAARLQAKLSSPQSVLEKFRYSSGQVPDGWKFADAMREYRDKYVSIVISIEKIVAEMKMEAEKTDK